MLCDNILEFNANPFNIETVTPLASDPTFDPQDFGKSSWWRWLIFGFGAALVIAASITLIVASAGSATGLIGSIAVGAAEGALIGAVAGGAIGVAGGAIYGAVTDSDMGDSILSGFLIGFGVGAVVGAVIGGAVGYYNYQPTQITGFTKHGINNVISRNGHGVNESALLDAVNNPSEIIGQAHRTKFKFIGKNATVILNKTGKVITAWARNSAGWRYAIGLWLWYELDREN